MKRTQPLRIGEIIENVVRSEGLEDNMLAHRALTAWGSIVGPAINRLTTERRVAPGGVMLVRIVSAPLRQELSMQRTPLIEALNKSLGKKIITDIRFI